MKLASGFISYYASFLYSEYLKRTQLLCELFQTHFEFHGDKKIKFPFDKSLNQSEQFTFLRIYPIIPNICLSTSSIKILDRPVLLVSAAILHKNLAYLYIIQQF